MKRYIVRVQYTKSSDLVWLVKAKNDKALENTIAIAYADSQSLIDGYEYEAINNHKFKKNDINCLCGNWVGVDIMKDDLKKLKERDVKKSTTIEDMFKSINNNKKVFDKEGYFIENIYEKYAQKVADKFFNGNIDELDKLCEEEHCFKESRGRK